MRNETFFFSARAQELLGLDPGEPLRPVGEWMRLFRYHPDDEKRMHDGLQTYLDGGGAHWEDEYRLYHQRSGEWRWFRDRGVALLHVENIRRDHPAPTAARSSAGTRMPRSASGSATRLRAASTNAGS